MRFAEESTAFEACIAGGSWCRGGSSRRFGQACGRGAYVFAEPARHVHRRGQSIHPAVKISPRFNHNQLNFSPNHPAPQRVTGAARSEVQQTQQKQGVATGVSHPEPVGQPGVTGAASSAAQQKQGVATNVTTR